MLALIGLIILAWLLIQTPPVQNWLVKQVTTRLSRDLHTTVSVKQVDFSLFNKMMMEGVLAEDQQHDTLLYAGALKVRISDWFFLKNKIDLHYIGLDDATIHLQRSDTTWNYRFLIDYFSGSNPSAQKSDLSLSLEKIELNHVKLWQEDRWRGEDLTLAIGNMDVDARQVDFSKKKIRVDNIDISEPSFSVYNYTGNRPDSLIPPDDTTRIRNDPKHLRWNPEGWDIVINTLTLKNGAFRNDRQTDRAPYDYFDGQHIYFSDINASFKKLQFRQDSITAHLVLSTKERSGLLVKQLRADVRMHPEAMEFFKLDLLTNHSHIHHFFAMRYDSFDDMDSFVSKVRMDGQFDNAELSSDDIAFFAPALADWKKNISVKGRIQGTVDNLHARHLVIEAGRNSYLNGDIDMRGLPDIDRTFIDFEANDFRTSYSDAVTLFPELRQITQPRLSALQYLRFKGNFTGFIKDFVTYGTVETALGSMTTDLNMKFPSSGIASYSGNLKMTNFELGQFVDASQMGRFSFHGKINGSGLRPRTLNANLDGTVDLLEFQNYPYQNLVVKGTVAKELFNGELVSTDPNLDLHLKGLVDMSRKTPEFNFEAELGKADLNKLHWLESNVQFNGKFRVNFTGDNIDNFLGTARVYDASLYKKGERISFDSLYIESKMMGTNKVITVLSNEFDGALVGEFSIRDMPAAFQTFLNKYYPSYIAPSRSEVKNENFSFVITTKKINEYIDIINKDLSGFNYSTFTGRINTHENLLDLNAEVPQFGFRNVNVYNFNFKGTGNLDSLVAESNIADVYINDSLHFPGTAIRIRSGNDHSDLSIQTSSNQTLNSANIAAHVQTLPNGVRILFDNSHFDLNSKSWTIEKNGELVLTHNMVSADGVKIYNGQQEIGITTVPSDIGNTNDIRIRLAKVNIGDFSPYIVRDNRLEGLLNGTVTVMDPFGRMQIDAQADAEQFRLDDDSIGRLIITSNYNQHTGQLNFLTRSDNKDYTFDVRGAYNILDSTGKKPLDIDVDVTRTHISLLKKYLTNVFTDIDGYATGKLHITGPPDDPKYLGQVQLQDGQLRVNYTNVLYKIPLATFDFEDGYIDFGSFPIYDELGNMGKVTKGRLYHRNFNDLAFDFAISTNKMLVLSTSDTGDEPYFGNVIAKASMTLEGPLENMRMNIKGEPADSSSLYIKPRGGRQVGQADFLEWKVYGREMKPQRSRQESNLTVRLDVTANNYLHMYVIMDELTGDIIEATGRGNLNMRATTNGEFSITGRYDIDRGKYNFNFESLLRKPFILRPDAGNYIQWTGDPYDANIKIDAEYVAENVRFSDLDLDQLYGGTGNSSSISENVKKYRGEVIVVATLTEKLTAPRIRFQIELPPNSPLKNDAGAQNVLRLIQDNENELNKQVAFLIVFNSFGPVSNSTNQGTLANQAFQGLVVNSISGVISNTLSHQFSNIFQKVFNDRSIQVNFNAQLYSGTNYISDVNKNSFNIDRTNLNLSIGKSFLNERLTFTFGSALDFGLTTAQVQATRNLQFLPDINAEWKIRQDGKLVLSFFYRDSYTYLTGIGTRQNSSGASISYRHDFDRISDLWKGERRKKNRAKATPPPPVIDSTKSDTSGTD